MSSPGQYSRRTAAPPSTSDPRHGPRKSAYAAHGLSDIRLDRFEYSDEPAASLYSPSGAAWISGTAIFEPGPNLALLHPHSYGSTSSIVPLNDAPFREQGIGRGQSAADQRNGTAGEQWGRRVRFDWCDLRDPDVDVFRRRAQFIALDTLPPPPGPSSVIHTGVKYSLVTEAIGWWEDDQGAWFLTRTGDEQSAGQAGESDSSLTKGKDGEESLQQYWDRMLEEQPGKWSQPCFLLEAVVEVLQALHQRDLTLLSCRPANFSVRGGRPYLSRFDDVACLPSFALPAQLRDTSFEQSPLFLSDPSNQGILDDDYVRRNLRYLSPAAAGSRRITRQSDIFSLGVLSYELVSGQFFDGRDDVDEPESIDLLVDIHKHLIVDVIPPLEIRQRDADFGAQEIPLPPRALSDIVVKCLAKDPDDGYYSLESLAYDFRRLGQVCKADGKIDKFIVGNADTHARFSLPKDPIYRERELDILRQTWKSVNAVSEQASENESDKDYEKCGTVRLVNFWGLSGSGKTRVVQTWAKALEESRAGQDCLIAECKLDEFSQRPISSFIQIFQNLLDRTLADPEEDPKLWNRKIREALGAQFSVFHAILPNDYRRLLLMGAKPPPLESINWTTFLASFTNWSKRLLQIFANLSRPLVIIIDDLQWMRSDEVDIWRSLIEGSQPLNHVMVVTMSRTQDDDVAPPPSALISAAGQTVHIQRLPEQGVTEYIENCFRAGVQGLATLASFLFAETVGSPLYLKSLMLSLVKENVLYFDYDVFVWRFDPLVVQAHLSDAGVDAYLDRIQSSLSVAAKGFLQVLSCLPVSGARPELIMAILSAEQGRETRVDVGPLISQAQLAGAVLLQGSRVRFSHDRQRGAAYNSMSSSQAAERHLRLATFLSQPEHLDDHIFEAANHLLSARKLGKDSPEPQSAVELLMEAASRSTYTASFTMCKAYLDTAEKIMIETGGIPSWLRHSRDLCFRHIDILSKLCGILDVFDQATAELDMMIEFCETDLEQIRMQHLRVQQLIAAMRHGEAMALCFSTLARFGYEVNAPSAHTVWVPTTQPEIDSLQVPTMDTADPLDKDIPSVIMSMLGHAGSSIFVSEAERRRPTFALGLSLAIAGGLRHPASAYLVATYGLCSPTPSLIPDFCNMSKKIGALRPTSYLTSSALAAIAAVVHTWLPMEAVVDELTPTFQLTMSLGNYELSSYVFSVDLEARGYKNRRRDMPLIMARYDQLKEHLTPANRILVNSPLQYCMKMLEPAAEAEPWLLSGTLISPAEVEALPLLAFHQSMYYTLQLRLAIVLDAPLPILLSMISKHKHLAVYTVGTIYGSEWNYLCMIVLIRAGVGSSDEWRIACMRDVEGMSTKTAFYKSRLNFLLHLEVLSETTLKTIASVDAYITTLTNDHEYAHAGLLNRYMADAIDTKLSLPKLSAGYIRAAFDCFKAADMPAVCQVMKARYPQALPNAPKAILFPKMSDTTPEQDLPPGSSSTVGAGPPVLGRTATSTSHETSNSTTTSKDRKESKDDPLDALTLIRSSLALASEQDSEMLLCTLLRISCQFARADYAAIALTDEDDRNELRLRAAGRSGRILAHDVRIGDALSDPMTRVDGGTRVRVDPFYGGKPPRSLLCLPIQNRGIQVGVIFLSSSATTSTQLESIGAREVISALATFATITTLNQSFTQTLQREVAQRTSELSNALQAKTQFLSQCSHELRSPLSAVLGLSAVLEASPGLSEVQREHLRTIIISGEDLLGLINNILDLSRLESQSVTLEHIPFNLRDLVEGALDMLATTAQKKTIEICLISSITTDPPELVGDGFRIKQILMNLLSNAVKFTPVGQVTVKWRHEMVESDGRDKCKITLDVEDTGIGIPASRMDKLFRNFSQVDESTTRSFGGTGLGLVISRNLAELLGGTCGAVSEYGKGSTFTFSFVADISKEGKPVEHPKFPSPRSCFIMCKPGPWWDMLEENLAVLQCNPVRFAESPDHSLRPDEKDGLNSHVDFDFVMVDTQLITLDLLHRMQKLQPKAKFVYLVQSMDLASAMKEFEVSRGSIIARPIKFSSLYKALFTASDVDVPIPNSLTRKTKRKKADSELAKRNPLKILIVDDNAVNVLVGRRILAMFGYDNIDSASDGQQSVEAAEKAAFDLILMDLQMPILDGFTAMQRIQASPLAGDPFVVILTADAQPEIKDKCIAGGCFDHMTKPLNIAKLESILVRTYQERYGERTVTGSKDGQAVDAATTEAED